MSTDKLLTERGKTHGDYSEQARMTQRIKATLAVGKNWQSLTVVQRDALDMIAVKLGRILSGDPNALDHWHDIAGYATLPTKHK